VAKKNFGWQAGMLVLTRRMYGTNAGTIDEENLYRIQRIGTKQATIQRVDAKTGEVPPHRRGHNIYLMDKEEAERRASGDSNSSWRSLYPYDWSQVFVAKGEAGWDADFNF
jgi:hypothetical protein